MNDPTQADGNRVDVNPAIEIAIRIGILVILISLCFQILRPFVSLVIWSIILAVAINPACRKLTALLGGRARLASFMITVATLLIIIIPSVQLAGSLIDGIKDIHGSIERGELDVPPPPDNIAKWPVIGKSFWNTWHQASVNLEESLKRFGPQIKAISRRLLESAIGSGLGLLQFTLSIIIAGILMVNAGEGGKVARALFVRLAGNRGVEFADISTTTIRNVVKGILGVAIIQSLLAGVGFGLAGVPAAGVWSFLCLLFAIIQIGIAPVTIPVIIYMFSSADTITAGLLTVWLIIVSIMDNFLKPVLLGRKAPVPMLVIFLGTIGGFISMGFIGLFIGAVILSLGFKLLQAWLEGYRSAANGSCLEKRAAGETPDAAG
jgi:predicted PurR-regulated permease PerM